MTASKARGTKWETDLLKELRLRGERVYRHTLSGQEDEGDLSVEDNDINLVIVIEAKDCRAFTPSSFVDEALKERDNYARHRGLDPANIVPIAIVKRRGKSVKDAYVLTTLDEYFRKA